MLKVTVIGNVGKEPELRYNEKGTAICKFPIAASNAKTDKPVWLDVVGFNKQGETLAQYVHKGSKLYIEGRLQVSNYTGKDGKDKQSLGLMVSEFTLLDSKPTQPATTSESPDSDGNDDFPF